MARTKPYSHGTRQARNKKRKFEADDHKEERSTKKVVSESEWEGLSDPQSKVSKSATDVAEDIEQQEHAEESKPKEEEDAIQSKKSEKKKRKKGDKKKSEDEHNDHTEIESAPKEEHIDDKIALMDPALLADHFAKVIRKHADSDTSIELEEKDLPTKAFRDHTSFTQPHLAANLPDYLRTFAESDLLRTVSETASPHTVVVAESGIQAANLFRSLKQYNTENHRVAKFFASKMKLKHCVQYMNTNKVGIVVGTPYRLTQMVEGKHIKIDQLKRIVVDASHMDQKKRTIFDQKDTFLPLLNLLSLKDIKSRYGNGIEIMVF